MRQGMGPPDRAGLLGSSSVQRHRSKAGTSQPPLEVLRKLASALQVFGDTGLVEDGERGPDEEFRLQFEAFTAFSKDEKKAAKAILDALILKHQARRWVSASSPRKEKPGRQGRAQVGGIEWISLLSGRQFIQALKKHWPNAL